jgi:exosortase/archaeosortase family protein
VVGAAQAVWQEGRCMTWFQLQLVVLVYLAGLMWFHRHRWAFARYLWGAFGFAFLAIQLSVVMAWHVSLAALETAHVRTLMALVGVHIQIVDDITLLVPDPTGWSGLRFGIECSTLIELSVFGGLMLFYPRLTLSKRWTYLAWGAVCTYGLNLVRICVIVILIGIGGKPIVPVAHAIVGRLVYFFGIVVLYWFLLTQPTLLLIRRSIEITGRAVR